MSRVLIGIIANDAARFSEFMACTLRLQRPEGSEVEVLIGGDWCGARNALAELTLEGGYTHLWFMDDDHSFPPDLLLRLLAWEKPLVNPMCLTRTFPFSPVTYTSETGAAEGNFLPLDFDGQPGEGLVELVAAGCAGMLIEKGVLEAVKRPWFEHTERSEDIVFCEKARRAGFTLWGDLGARLGHITTAVVWPSYDPENGWTTGLTVGKDMNLLVPPAAKLVEQLQEELPETEIVFREAERIEIWIDDELRWWWRALDDDGNIIAKDSGINEETVIQAGLSAYPNAPIFQIQREIDDSRNPKQYGPPTRLWNREVH